MLGLIRPSGGLLYHWRARRHTRLWEPFRREIEQWLSSWNIPKKELVLVGPSAGYTLPRGWLEGFAQITAYDQDPLAPFFFKRQHPQANVTFKQQNLFWRNAKLSLIPLKEVLERHPGSPILFSNVLGQVLLEGPAEDFEWGVFLLGMRSLLKERRWASYHDRLTHEHGEIIDHMTGGAWTEELETRSFRWQLTPKSLHEIEGVRD